MEKVAASAKDIAAWILIARSCSRMAYSANPPGRGLPEVAANLKKIKISRLFYKGSRSFYAKSSY